jgi:integrase
VGGLAVDGGRVVKPIGLGEHGDVIFGTEKGRTVAIVQYRDFMGRKRRVKRAADSKAAARRLVLKAVDEALRRDGGVTFTASTRFSAGIDGWLSYVESLVERGARSPSTLDQYRDTVRRHVRPGLGGLRLGEVSTPRVDRFLQGMLADKGYATAKICRTVMSGICGWLVRQGGLIANPVREVTPLEAGSARQVRALDAEQISGWLSVVDASEYARRWDLPDLVRFMLGTGLRIGEALGVCWPDVDLDLGTLSVERTVIRVRGRGLQAKRLKTTSSARVLMLPDWCVRLLESRREQVGGDGPIFPDARGGFRDRNNVAGVYRRVREGTSYEWVTPHTYRRTVATLLDSGGASARLIADQLGHSRVSMTQDYYMGRKSVASEVADVLNLHDPDRRRDDGEASA